MEFLPRSASVAEPETRSVYLHDRAFDRARAVGTVEVVDHHRPVRRNHGGPRVAEIDAAAIITQHDFRRRGGIGTFRLEYARANAIRLVPVTIDQQHAIVREAAGVERMP